METQGWELATLAKWRGRDDFVAEAGAKLGSLEAVVYDYKTGVCPLWLGVGGGLFHPHMLLMPAGTATSEAKNARRPAEGAHHR